MPFCVTVLKQYGGVGHRSFTLYTHSSIVYTISCVIVSLLFTIFLTIDQVNGTVHGNVYWCFLLSPIIVVVFLIIIIVFSFVPFPIYLWMLSLNIVNVPVNRAYYLYLF